MDREKAMMIIMKLQEVFDNHAALRPEVVKIEKHLQKFYGITEKDLLKYSIDN